MAPISTVVNFDKIFQHPPRTYQLSLRYCALDAGRRLTHASENMAETRKNSVKVIPKREGPAKPLSLSLRACPGSSFPSQ